MSVEPAAEPGSDVTDATAPRPRRRTVLAVGAVAAVTAATALSALALGETRDVPAPAASASRAGGTVSVLRETLVDRSTVDGELGYGAESPVLIRATGTVTWLPKPGTTVKRGSQLLRVDDRPVVLLYGDLPMYRELGPPAPPPPPAASSPAPDRSPAPSPSPSAAPAPVHGRDIRQLQTNLRALGYSGFTVNGVYTSATARAVRRWQRDLGMAATGKVGLGDVVYASGPVRVSGANVRLGAPVQQEALRSTGTVRRVTVSVPVEEGSWAVEGAQVTVRLPGGRSVAGAVTGVGQPTAGSEASGGAETVPVTIGVRDQKALGQVRRAPVTVTYVRRQRKDVLAVPVAALVALAEGGYGLETSSGAYVPARTGMFADGKVEVSGPQIRAGMKVRVPQ
ncbi:peptidoglycan-binding domain-containing protein [Streptomyces niveiscabiei]|uniref:peptidoglycan-binding domain-containing protein n=1 Tax=Streptomyces niveiscabiei TaxID=164115 RepID=UPI0029BB20DE|nr:peptidoglycan-binding domain-containing protein [Streptomyces niveiscabiei]MDX3386261.1 peptidoglycan-binding domain-containing protein [Streptomyces niveiscabiei]